MAKNHELPNEIGERLGEGKDVGCVNGGVWQRITQTTYILEVDGQSLLGKVYFNWLLWSWQNRAVSYFSRP